MADNSRDKTDKIHKKNRKKKKNINNSISDQRKNNRYEILSKRRWNRVSFEDQSNLLDKIKKNVKSYSPESKLLAVQDMRKLPFIENVRVIEFVIPILVEFLQKRDRPELQRESAWTLKCIASAIKPDQVTAYMGTIVDAAAKLLLTAQRDVQEAVISLLDSIVSSSVVSRDFVLKHAAFENLLLIIEKNNIPQRSLWNVMRVITHVCSEEYPPLPVSTVKQLVSVLKPLLNNRGDPITISEIVWSFSGIAYHGPEYIKVLFDSDIFVKVMSLLDHEDEDVVVAALAVISNIFNGNSSYAKALLEFCLLNRFLVLLTHSSEEIRLYSAKVFTKLLTRHRHLIENVDSHLRQILVHLLRNVSLEHRNLTTFYSGKKL